MIFDWGGVTYFTPNTYTNINHTSIPGVVVVFTSAISVLITSGGITVLSGSGGV